MGQRPTRELRGWEKNLERERERERENGTEVGSLWGAFIYILEEVEFIASVSLFLGCGFQWSEQGRGHWVEEKEEEEEAVPRGGGYRIYGCWKPSTSEGEEREPRERPVKVY